MKNIFVGLSIALALGLPAQTFVAAQTPKRKPSRSDQAAEKMGRILAEIGVADAAPSEPVSGGKDGDMRAPAGGGRSGKDADEGVSSPASAGDQARGGVGGKDGDERSAGRETGPSRE
jgi:hypothetical protein